MRREAILIALFVVLIGCGTATQLSDSSPLPPSITPIPTAQQAVICTPQIVTCAPTPTLVREFVGSGLEMGFLLVPFDSSCQPPCWRGLQVGQSTKTQVI